MNVSDMLSGPVLPPQFDEVDVLRRIAKLEAVVTEVSNEIFALRQQLIQVCQGIQVSAPAPASSSASGTGGSVGDTQTPTKTNGSPSAEGTDVVSKLMFGNVPTLWFTKRPMPPIEVTIHDATSGNRLYVGQGWRVKLELISFDDRIITNVLTSDTESFPFAEGRAVIAGIKFASVSSKNGGDFRLKASIISATASSVKSCTSTSIRVISERLYSETKASCIADLLPSDKLIHIPSLGKKYSKRLADMGYATVSDLAHLNPQRFPSLIAALKSGRGTITEDRLEDIIRQCQEVVLRYHPIQTPMQAPIQAQTPTPNPGAQMGAQMQMQLRPPSPLPPSFQPNSITQASLREWELKNVAQVYTPSSMYSSGAISESNSLSRFELTEPPSGLPAFTMESESESASGFPSDLLNMTRRSSSNGMFMQGPSDVMPSSNKRMKTDTKHQRQYDSGQS